MAEQRKLKLGFIGLGQATNKLLMRRSEIEQLPYTIAAAADPRAHARDAFTAEFGGRAWADARELCEHSDVDVVYIATPAEFHREHVEIAARSGKHIVVEKPMALCLEDCEAMIAATDRAGVKMLAGHTHSFDAPIRKMREIIASGELGDLRMVNTWNFNEFSHRPRLSSELHTTIGPILNQGPHQVDIVRQIGGGLVRSVRATVIPDILSGEPGGYTCHLEFQSGVPATMVYDGRGLFDTAELFWWVSEGGLERDPGLNARRRRAYQNIRGLGGRQTEEALESAKEEGRYGAASGPAEKEEEVPPYQPFFGLTVVSCDRGTMRQSKEGLYIYDDNGRREIILGQELRGRAAELQEIYDGIVNNRPIFHDGRWAMATLEVCLAIADARSHTGEATMKRQTETNDQHLTEGAQK